MKYEVILLDADDTLFDYQKAEAYAFKKALILHLGEYKREYLKEYRAINKAVWKEFEEGLIEASMINQRRFQLLFRTIEGKVDPYLFGNSYIEFLHEADFLLEGARFTLDSLSGLKRVLVTNGLSSVQHARLERASLKDSFDSLIISEEVGVAKPHEGIFLEALKSVDHEERETVLMVGDSLTSDIRGGVEFGIHTCWFNAKGEVNRGPWQPTYMIRRLEELLYILG